jgi:D-glycero-D-manno-heptose 1,7-bisphosphate phosphatase
MQKPEISLRKVVFLDRDGVINEDSPAYVKSWEEFRFIPGSLEAIRDLTAAGCAVIVISNQSAINRNLISPETVEEIHCRMRAAVETAGGAIRDVFFCPHHPDERCNCRKPEPGLIRRARDRYGIDLAASVMVGDSATDILSGRNAGCGATVLVETGNGLLAADMLKRQKIVPDRISENLYAAAPWIIRRLCRVAPGTEPKPSIQ